MLPRVTHFAETRLQSTCSTTVHPRPYSPVLVSCLPQRSPARQPSQSWRGTVLEQFETVPSPVVDRPWSPFYTGAAPAGPPRDNTREVSQMRTRQMGRDGPNVPVVCFGTWPLGGAYGSVEEGTAIATMHAAMDAGLTFIDTAEGYMNAEAIIGKAIAGRRDELLIATKVSSDDHSTEHITSAIENSLRQMRIDYVDLYQLHRATDRPIEDTMADLLKLRDAGKLRYIGISNFSAEQIAAAAASRARQQRPAALQHALQGDGGRPAARLPGQRHRRDGTLSARQGPARRTVQARPQVPSRRRAGVLARISRRVVPAHPRGHGAAEGVGLRPREAASYSLPSPGRSATRRSIRASSAPGA